MRTIDAVLGSGMIWLVGCSDTSDVAHKSMVQADLGTLRAAIEVSEGNNDVTAVRFDVVSLGQDCDDVPLASEVVALRTETSEPDFADVLFVLEVGDYRLCATPLATQASSDDCSRTEAEVAIQHEVTTELALVCQCANPDQGGLDAVVSFNDAPSITRIELDPSGTISVCESVTAFATATDPNGDAVVYAWSMTMGPAEGNLASTGATATFSGPVGDYSIMVEVDDGHGGTDRLEFPVSVTDAECPGGIDTTPPEAATGLEVAIQSRRESSFRLTWTPPEEEVEGYDVAYVALAAGDVSSVIDDTNFDDAVPAPDVTGAADEVVVHDLMIEKRYLFAVRPYDAAGNVGPVVATTVPVAAEFQTLVLAPPAVAVPGTQWGFSVDASTDLDGDGAADMVVGQKYGDRVYIYLGEPGGTYSSSPNAVIIGPPDSGFGASVAVVGNIVGGGHEDIAIAAPTDGPVLGRVYVVSGRAWQGETVDISDGINSTGSVIDFPTTSPYPAHVVRLGDFDGDGNDDFGIHALGYGPFGACDPDTLANCVGAFLLIKGASNPSNFPSSVTVPEDDTSFEAYLPSTFGFYGGDWLLGITDLIEGRSGVLAAEYQAGVQRILTRDPTQLGGFDAQLLDYGPPQFYEDTVTYDTELGSYPGALVGASTLAVQLTNARDGLGTTPGIVDLYALSPTDSFAAPIKTFKAGGETNNFGQILVGNRYSGRPSAYNLPFFGRDAQAPTVIVGGRYFANKLPKLFMLSATTIASLPTNPAGHELTGTADVEYLLSSVPGINPDWTDSLGAPSEDADWHGGIGFPIHDMNEDGFADLGITEWDFEAAYTGGIVILY